MRLSLRRSRPTPKIEAYTEPVAVLYTDGSNAYGRIEDTQRTRQSVNQWSKFSLNSLFIVTYKYCLLLKILIRQLKCYVSTSTFFCNFSTPSCRHYILLALYFIGNGRSHSGSR